MPSVERYKSGKGAHATPYVNTVKLTRLVTLFWFFTMSVAPFSHTLIEAKIQGSTMD